MNDHGAVFTGSDIIKSVQTFGTANFLHKYKKMYMPVKETHTYMCTPVVRHCRLPHRLHKMLSQAASAGRVGARLWKPLSLPVNKQILELCS